jgi:hypothetical protein
MITESDLYRFRFPSDGSPPQTVHMLFEGGNLRRRFPFGFTFGFGFPFPGTQ